MIKCPECGQAASDDAKFCDRCGQGLHAGSAPALSLSPPPLSRSVRIKGGFEIVELLGQSAHENRYRATRECDGKIERFQLRERLAAPRYEGSQDNPPVGATVSAPEEDPSGPHAKTRELKPLAARMASEPAVVGPVTQVLAEPSTDEVEAASVESELPAEDLADAPADAGAAGDEGPKAHQADTEAAEGTPLVLTEALAEDAGAGGVCELPPALPLEGPDGHAAPAGTEGVPPSMGDDLGELFGRVLALSMTLNHPAFQRALEGFADNGRVYLVYPDEELVPVSRRPGGLKMREPEALGVAIQVCQAVSFINRRGLRVNDICPESVAYGADGRIKLTGLDWVSNDTELQSEPLLNDGYTAPEIYRGKRVDKRADVFSVGALLYTCLTGERLECESWREEAGPIRFYRPHVVSPALEQAARRALMFDPAERWPNIDAFKAELTRLNTIIRVRSSVLTDVGMVRELNEDSVLAVEYTRDSQVEPEQNFLYVVADGMGGAEAGETASAIAVATIRNYVETRLSTEERKNLRELLRAALEEANRKILEYQAAHPESRGMGSTAVSALIVPPEAVVAWVGDSRAYLCDGNSLRQVSKDHSLVQRLIEIGQITSEEARHHEHKNVITRSLGARQSGPAGAEVVPVRLRRGDRLLLCSDGLVAHVDDKMIGEVLLRHDDPFEASRELVVAANAGGGTDNVSVIVISVC